MDILQQFLEAVAHLTPALTVESLQRDGGTAGVVISVGDTCLTLTACTLEDALTIVTIYDVARDNQLDDVLISGDLEPGIAASVHALVCAYTAIYSNYVVVSSTSAAESSIKAAGTSIKAAGTSIEAAETSIEDVESSIEAAESSIEAHTVARNPHDCLGAEKIFDDGSATYGHTMICSDAKADSARFVKLACMLIAIFGELQRLKIAFDTPVHSPWALFVYLIGRGWTPSAKCDCLDSTDVEAIANILCVNIRVATEHGVVTTATAVNVTASAVAVVTLTLKNGHYLNGSEL
jgi:hypothetical protein